MSKVTIATESWEAIKNERKHYANTATRVGDAGLAIIDALLDAISNLKSELLGGASEAFDTFKELQTLLENDAVLVQTILSGLSTEVTNRQNSDYNLSQNKVDKVAGKGLSTNDYDETAKQAVDNFATAISNAINGESQSRNQAISIAISSLKNDLLGGASEAFDTFKELQTLLENDAVLVQTILTGLSSKVDKVAGKGLSTNDFDDEFKSIVENLPYSLQAKLDAIYGNTYLLFFGNCSEGFPDVNSNGELVFDTITQKLYTSFLFGGVWQWMETELRQDTVYVYAKSYYLWNSTALSFTQLSDGSGGSGELDPAILLKINQAYNFAQQSCVTDDNGEIYTDDNGDVIIDL